MELPNITICVLSYNRPDYLEDTLRSIFAQTWVRFRVVVLDNASSISYARVIGSCSDVRLTYIRHSTNLGLWGNFAFAIEHYSTDPLLMIFHDDNLMHPRLLEREMEVMLARPNLAWVSCQLKYFRSKPPLFESNLTKKVKLFNSARELAADLLSGANKISFGPVLYRSSALKRVNLKALTEACSIIADRPILFHAMTFGGAALLLDPMELYREHPTQISNTGPLTGTHLIGLAHQYRLALSPDASARELWRFRFWCALNLPDSYFRLPRNNRPRFLNFVRQCSKAEVLDWWLIPWFPIRRGLGFLVRKLRNGPRALMADASQ